MLNIYLLTLSGKFIFNNSLATAADGIFLMNIKSVQGRVSLVVSCVGYASKKIDFTLERHKVEYDMGIVPICA